jgi:hypothetical protein
VELRPQIFREVSVTQAQCDELQRRLKLHTGGGSQDYPIIDVLNVKLDLLRSFPQAEASSPQLLDDNDIQVDDDSDTGTSSEDEDMDLDEDNRDLRSLFPSILRFLDLSSLELKESVSDRLPLPLLLRQEYKHISELIEKRPRSSAGSVIVSGQPGTGEFLISLSDRI